MFAERETHTETDERDREKSRQTEKDWGKEREKKREGEKDRQTDREGARVREGGERKERIGNEHRWNTHTHTQRERKTTGENRKEDRKRKEGTTRLYKLQNLLGTARCCLKASGELELISPHFWSSFLQQWWVGFLSPRISSQNLFLNFKTFQQTVHFGESAVAAVHPTPKCRVQWWVFPDKNHTSMPGQKKMVKVMVFVCAKCALGVCVPSGCLCLFFWASSGQNLASLAQNFHQGPCFLFSSLAQEVATNSPRVFSFYFREECQWAE